MLPVLDGERLLEDLTTLAQIGANPGGGINRIAFSPADRQGRAWVEARMKELGLHVRTDPAGNNIGLYPGREDDLPPIALGSHTDTVPDGGAFDGAPGVLAALACVRALHEAGLRLRHPVEVINFAAEEATMAGATFGSRAMAGLLDPAVMDQPAWDDRPVAGHLREAGLDPALYGDLSRVCQPRRHHADGPASGCVGNGRALYPGGSRYCHGAWNCRYGWHTAPTAGRAQRDSRMG
jgi:N-carbamoyl-L-amino-acid hydrolase